MCRHLTHCCVLQKVLATFAELTEQMYEYWLQYNVSKLSITYPAFVFSFSPAHVWSEMLQMFCLDSSGVKLGYLISYDLLHVPWNTMGLLPQSWLFFSLHVRKTTEFVWVRFLSLLVCSVNCWHYDVQLFCRGHCHLVDNNVYQH